MVDAKPTAAYGSAHDLPSVKETMLLLKGAKQITRFVARKTRADLIDIERELQALMDSVDRFYAVLGDRNWIYIDHMNADRVDAAIRESVGPEDAENRLIAIYREPDFFKQRMVRLQNHEGIAKRDKQIRRAIKHYQADEFDSCTLQLIAVMDGFVNDLDPQKRTGLHARSSEEMVAWDSVVGHHMGLTHVMSAFKKPSYKRVDEVIFEVHRHGIVHGNMPNFDNVIVATKAWNMFFAVIDWADAREKKEAPQDPRPSWRELATQLSENAAIKSKIAQFEPSIVLAGDSTAEINSVWAATEEFLDSWKTRNWGRVRDFVIERNRRGHTYNELAGEVKAVFSSFDLQGFEVERIEHQAAGLSVSSGRATVNDQPGRFECRFIYESETGDSSLPTDGGLPRLVFCDPTVFTAE